MEENSRIVFSNSFGFGKVIESDNKAAKVIFNDGKKRTIALSFLEIVEQKTIDYFLNKKYLSKFSEWTLEKAQRYANLLRITELQYENDHFFAKVRGSKTYEVSLNFDQKGLRLYCDCPVEGKCKHMAAVCIYLDVLFTQLIQLQVKPVKKTVVLSLHFEDLFSDYSNATDQEVARFLLDMIEDILKNFSDEYIFLVLNYLNDHYLKNAYLKQLIKALCYNDQIRSAILNQLEEISRIRIYSMIKSELGKAQRSREWFYYGGHDMDYEIFNCKYQEYIEQAIGQDHFTANRFYLLEAIRRCQISDSLFEKLKVCFKNNTLLRRLYVQQVFEQVEMGKKLELLKDFAYNIDFDFSVLEGLTLKERKEILPYIQVSKQNIDNIFQELKSQDYDKKTVITLLTKMKDFLTYKDTQKQINQLLKNYPDSDYFSQYLQYDSNSLRFYQTYQLIQYDPVVQLDQASRIADYFYCQYRFETYSNQYTLELSLIDFCQSTVAKYEITSDQKYSCSFKLINLTNSQTLDSQIINYIYQQNKEQIETEKRRIEERIAERVKQQQIEQLYQDFDFIDQCFEKQQVSLNTSHKAHLTYFFRFLQNSVLLELKVGVDKSYVVKNMRTFLANFLSEKTERYGKNLVLTHKTSNFVDKDKEVLEYLLLQVNTVDYQDYRNERFLRLNSFLFERICHILKGTTVSIETVNNPVLLRLKSSEVTVQIDEDYRLHFHSDSEQDQLFVLDHSLFIYHSKDRALDKIRCTWKELHLYQLAYRNNHISVAEVLDDFKDKIYSRYYQNIEVAEALKQQFQLSILQINAYFDYQDKEITVRTELIKEDKVCEIEDLTNKEDINKVNQYQQYLASIGFVDDCLLDEANILTFLSMDLADLKAHCAVYLSESIKNKQVITFRPAVVKISYENQMMQAFYQQSEFSDEELEQIIKAIRRKKKFVLLTKDRIIDITNQDSQEFLQVIDDVGLSQAHLNEKKQINIVQALKAFAYENQVSLDQYLANMMKEITSFKKSRIEIPSMNAQLRSYQKDGYRWMKILSNYQMGGILADDMGLGKTLEVITLLVSDPVQQPNLVVCPKSLVFNWKNEFYRFAPQEKVVEVYGSKEERAKIIQQIDQHQRCTYVTSYDSLRNDQDDYRQHFNYLIIDEAQYIKNVNALKTLSVKQLQANHKFALTGTPIENNIIDLWSIFDFILPGYLSDVNQFKTSYSPQNMELIKRKVSPFILRRTKQNVLKDLPGKYERILTAEMTNEQKKIYDATVKQARDLMQQKGKVFDVLPYLMRLRQICVDPKTFIEDYQAGSGKMELLEETVLSYVSKGHKILVFSQFVKALQLVEERLKKHQLAYFMITGETDGKKRIEICEQFNQDSAEKICLVSLKAAGTGLNLIGADTVIHLDPWWNVSAENQATDRTHRIGQTNSVEVIKLICENSIEQRVIELQNIKKDLIDKVISNDESSITKASLEDIRFILD